jgi:hypothetical protein
VIEPGWGIDDRKMWDRKMKKEAAGRLLVCEEEVGTGEGERGPELN